MHTGIIRKERVTRAGAKLYPIHLDDMGIFCVIGYFLENLPLFGPEALLASVRKGRGAKGVDFRIRISRVGEEVRRVRQYTFGINSNWEVEGFFDHWVDMNGKCSAEEIIGWKIPDLEQILGEMTISKRPPVRNKLFDGDDWTDVYEQYNLLAG